jgi:flagellar biosynthetic protein FliP
MRLLIPAFVTSELKTAFQIGFIIFIPFPDRRHGRRQRADVDGHDDDVAGDDRLPFKLMLFVLVDGWHLLLGSLVASFAT